MELERLVSARRDSELDNLIATFLAAADAGHAPEPELFIAQHPKFTAELTAFIESLRAMDGWTAPLRPIAQAALTTVLSTEADRAGVGTTVHAMIESIEPSFGDYELLERIGHGGMGVVYKARQRNPNRLVAIKMVRLSPAAAEVELARFRNEADVAAHLAHPNIMPIYEVGEHAGHLFFSMKLIEGGSLARQLDRFREDPRAAARLLVTIARAVHHAHQHGILHRDLKPSNVLLDGHQPIVTDFGLSKRLDAETTLTDPGAIVGTPAYMAPEQTDSKKVAITTASDVYGLGATLYAMLTGRPPFRALTALETLALAREQAPQPPRQLNPRIERDLETICLKALAKEPQRRYGSAEAMAEDLERWLAGKPIHARPVGPAERIWLLCRCNQMAASLAAFIVCGLVAGTALVWNERQTAIRERNDAQLQRQLAVERGESLRRHAYTSDVSLAFLFWQKGYGDQVRDLLDRQIPSADEVELRGFEWYFLDRLCVRSERAARTLTGHGSDVFAAVFSPDGRTLATTSRDATVWLWDLATARQTAVLSGHRGDANCASFSPDGQTLATSSDDGEIKLWDLRSNKVLATLPGDRHWLPSVFFLPDGETLVACGHEESIRLWDVQSRTKRASFGVDPGLKCINISADGKFVAAGSRDSLALWDLASIDNGPTWRRKVPQVFGTAFSHDGKMIASASDDGHVRLWVKATGSLLVEFSGVGGGVRTVAFSPDDRLLACGAANGTVRLWDTACRSYHSVLLGHDGEIWSLAFSPSGHLLVSTSADRTAKLWNLDNLLPPRFQLANSGPAFGSVSIAPNGDAIAWVGSADGNPQANAVTVLNVTTGESRAIIDAPDGILCCAVTQRDGGRIVTGGLDGLVRVFDLQTGQLRSSFNPNNYGIAGIKLSPDGRHAALTNDEHRLVALWDIGSSPPQAANFNLVNGNAHVFSPNGQILATSDLAERQIHLWNLVTGQEIGCVPSAGEFAPIEFSADSMLLAYSDGVRRLDIYDIEKRALASSLFVPTSALVSLAFTPDGQSVAMADENGSIHLWSMSARREFGSFKAHKGRVLAMSFSADGRTLISAGMADNALGEVRLWPAGAEEVTQRFQPELEVR